MPCYRSHDGRYLRFGAFGLDSWRAASAAAFQEACRWQEPGGTARKRFGCPALFFAPDFGQQKMPPRAP